MTAALSLSLKAVRIVAAIIKGHLLKLPGTGPYPPLLATSVND